MFWEKYQHNRYLLVYEILEFFRKKKKKKFPKGSTACSLRHYYGSLACPFSFLWSWSWSPIYLTLVWPNGSGLVFGGRS